VKRNLVLIVLIFANLLIWLSVWPSRQPLLTVAFLDVGQGDAIFITAPNGNQILIDGGPGRKVLSELGQVMPFYDRSIDLIIATHPDSDHIGGLPAALDNYEVAGFLEPAVACANAICDALEAKVIAEPAREIIASRGEKIILDDGVELEILSPAGTALSNDTNTASVVAKLTYGSTSFLFTGDTPKTIENYLIAKEGEKLDVDVLKVGHHGSDTSSSPEFLAATSPAIAVISVGQDNRYGHPKASVIDLLAQSGVKILRTDQEGRVILKSDGTKILSL
jgi:competence protein ComEC